MSGPLAGLRVVELPCIGPGPFATMLLADLGADVVRVDRPGGGGLQVIPPEQDLLGRGKRSVALDLKDAAAVERLLTLVERADLLVEGFRPGVAERLGVGPEDCLARAPQLVYGRMTGWGQDGPYAGQAGHDITYVAVAGALHAIGAAEGPPQVPLNLIGDFAGALYLTTGLLAALRETATSGRGQVVDAAMVDSTAHLMTVFHGLMANGAWRDQRGVNLLDGSAPFYGVYLTADGGWMAVGALEPPFYDELLRLLDIPVEAADRSDPSTWPALRGRLADAFSSRTREQWVAVFADSDACVAPVLSMTEAQHDPHLAARGTFTEHHGVVQPAPAPRFSRTTAALGRRPPSPGEHTDEVLADWLR
ncbi:MAG TPA: CaiB/BaiF CoA-transferase family protein [Streptosporangiales bacterium]